MSGIRTPGEDIMFTKPQEEEKRHSFKDSNEHTNAPVFKEYMRKYEH